jgi:glutamine amidotransferase
MIVIIDYGMGNLRSVLKAFKRIQVEAIVSSRIEDIQKADKLILPGVGHFKNGMKNLHELGIADILQKMVVERQTPILGICLGMQLFTHYSEEGSVAGLGWIDAQTIRFDFKGKGIKLRVPHMGWNTIKTEKHSPVLLNIDKNDLFYFVHSYHVVCKNESDIIATTTYGETFTSIIQHNNIVGVQFHPEKSHKVGLKLLSNFVIA